MSNIEKHAPGSFCWIELATTDQSAAKIFYDGLFGWVAADFPMGPDEVYTMFNIDGRNAAAAYGLKPEMRAQGIALLPPDVNESDIGFTALKGAIRYGLAAIKGIGFNSVNAIMRARDAGPFRSLFDFAERLEEGAINKRVLEGLVGSGAFDSLKADGCTSNQWRARHFAAIDVALCYPAKIIWACTF